MCLKDGFGVKAYNSFIIKWLYSTVKTQCEFTLEEDIAILFFPKDITVGKKLISKPIVNLSKDAIPGRYRTCMDDP